MKGIRVIIVMLLIAGLSAQRYGGVGSGRMAMRSDLNLTTEQIQKISDLRLELQKQQIDRGSELQKLRLELQEEMRTSNPNKKALNSLLEQINTIETQMEKARINHRLEVRSLLTDEQRVLFDQRFFGQGMGRRGNNGGPGACDGSGHRGRGQKMTW